MKLRKSVNSAGLAKVLQGLFNVVMATDIKPFYFSARPGKKYPIGQGGADFPIRPVHQFQAQAGGRSFPALQTFSQGKDSLFDFGFSLLRQMFKETDKYRFRIKQHYSLLRCCRKLLAELKTGPFERRSPASSLSSFFEGLSAFAVAVRREAFSISTAYSSNDSSTMGLLICVKA